MSSPGPSPTFSTLLQEIIAAAGGIDGLASATGVKKRTLGNWRTGKYPTSRVGPAVEAVDTWARQNMTDRYPPTGLPRGLIDLIKPEDAAAPPQPTVSTADEDLATDDDMDVTEVAGDRSSHLVRDPDVVTAEAGSSATPTDPPEPEQGRESTPPRAQRWTRPALLVGAAVLVVVAVLLAASLVNRSQNGASPAQPPVPPTTGTGGNSPSATPTVVPTPTGPRATFTPITTKITPGGNVKLVGQVTGLDNHNLWIFEQIGDSPEKFVISSDAAVANTDGEWRLTADQVGEPTDHGSSVKFVAVAADTACDQSLTTTVAQAGDGEASVKALPAGCLPIGQLFVDFVE